MVRNQPPRNIHRPLHVYLDDTNYFITIGTFHRHKLFNDNEKKKLLEAILMKTSHKYLNKIYGWVILDNHLHILVKTAMGKELHKFVNSLQGKSAIELNKLDCKIGRRVWYQYWDRCIRNEKNFYTRLNYIHHNSVKHKHVKNMENYEFSSYRYYLEKYGKEWLSDCFIKYPIFDFTPEDGDDF
jgi:putative transposase